MRYTTKGTCSMAIEYELDDEQRVRNVKIYRWLLWKYPGCSQTGRRHACKRSDQPSGRH